jgi:S-adenosylmethionine:tRNA ribosyltransferase-isomerase
VRTAELDFHLPPSLIATRPPDARDGGRLLVVGDPLHDARVVDLPDHVPGGALIVVNDTRVLRARLLGRKEATGGRVEVFLLEPAGDAPDPAATRARWRALGRSSKPLRAGARIMIDGDGLEVTVLAGRDGDATLDVELATRDGSPVAAAIEASGRIPLPPYVDRADDEADAERYQTVFAREPGAVAAPTAGLHLSEALLDRLRRRRVHVAACTLHVGLGTFQPIAVDDLDRHPMHTERFEVSAELAAAVASARERGAPVIAIGTTAVRALESAADPDHEGLVRATRGETRLLIQPGYRFRVVDALLTNFHLPRSTLLALVWAFGGRASVRAAYEHAIAAGYRFYSYGDAMLIPQRVTPEAAFGDVEAP